MLSANFGSLKSFLYYNEIKVITFTYHFVVLSLPELFFDSVFNVSCGCLQGQKHWNVGLSEVLPLTISPPVLSFCNKPICVMSFFWGLMHWWCKRICCVHFCANNLVFTDIVCNVSLDGQNIGYTNLLKFLNKIRFCLHESFFVHIKCYNNTFQRSINV